MSTTSAPPPSTAFSGRSFRRGVVITMVASGLTLAYVLRGVLIPLFFAFLLAYALDPFVDWLEARRVPRTLAAPVVMLAIATFTILILVFAIPMFVDELGGVVSELPSELKALQDRVEPWLWLNFHFQPPHTIGE